MLASADTGMFGVLIAVLVVLALAAKIGAAVARVFFGLIKIGIGLIILSIIVGIVALFNALGH
jgi:hypothetical protein